MVREGDDWKDLRAYIGLRIEHLKLELQKTNYTINPIEIREQAKRTLRARLSELGTLKQVVNGCIKDKSKYEYAKVKYLKEKKAEVLRKLNQK